MTQPTRKQVETWFCEWHFAAPGNISCPDYIAQRAYRAGLERAAQECEKVPSTSGQHCAIRIRKFMED